MRRWWFLLVPFLVAGCATWGQGGFDGGQSFDNRFDRSLGTANVSQLHEVWKLPGHDAVVGAGRVFAALDEPGPTGRHALVAYPESGCTGNHVPTCAPSWSVDGRYSPPVTDGTSVFAWDLTPGTLHAFAVDGTSQWTYTPPPVTPNAPIVSTVIRIADGRVWVMTEDFQPAGYLTSRLISLPERGCGAPTCAATLVIPGNLVLDFVAADGVLLTTRQTNPQGAITGHVRAYDPATGSTRWQSHENARVQGTRDGRVYAIKSCTTTGCTPGIVFPLTAGSNCTGTPTGCTAIASFPALTAPPVLTAEHTVVADEHGATWYAHGCTHACPSLASFALPGIPNLFGYAASGDLVFLAASPSASVSRIYAFDDSLANCPGGTCAPTWTADASAFVDALAAGNGRLYASEADGLVHVLGT